MNEALVAKKIRELASEIVALAKEQAEQHTHPSFDVQDYIEGYYIHATQDLKKAIQEARGVRNG